MNSQLKTRYIIWGAMLTSLSVYLLLALSGASQIVTKEMTPALSKLRLLLAAIAGLFLVSGFLIKLLKKRYFSDTPGEYLRGHLFLILQLCLFAGCSMAGMIFTLISGHIEDTTYATTVAVLGMLTALPKRS
jgi:drug/metabolite transporter (DMT)-like permease